MSHFTVLVVTDAPDHDVIEAALDPFNEADHFVAVDCTKEVVDAYANPTVDRELYPTIQSFGTRWFGYEVINYDDGPRFNYNGNPKAKWDWWVIGGRWQGSLQAKAGAKTYQGEGGVFHNVQGIALKNVDQVLKRDLDIDGMLNERRADTRAWFDRLISKIKGPNPEGTLEDAIHTKDRLFEEWKALAEPRAHFLDWMKAHSQWSRVAPIEGLSWDLPALRPEQTLQNYIDELTPLNTYAMLINGEWYQKGEMGWFGISSNENPDWKSSFKELFDNIPDDKWLTVVDCHI